MAIFILVGDEARRIDHFAEQAEQLAARLAAMDANDAKKVETLAKNFRWKVQDFFRAERRLNIGIVGQVKSGKSSFLNTLLFGGKSVLPKASTPKTATLTKIEYADENVMEIEYYSAEDWGEILSTAKADHNGAEYEAARELRDMAAQSGINTAALHSKGKERIEFNSPEELMERLNDYVGENGKYTALVKAVILYINDPLFAELSIVDTPGLNDPVLSRTLRTKEFIEICDVVFFLTPCGAFLDKSDWTLLSATLPQKGVKRLILVGSKFDSGLRDVLCKANPDDPFGDDPNSADTIPDAIELVRSKLTARAREKIAEYERVRSSNSDSDITNVIKGCGEPLFVSAMAENMSAREASSYDPEESNVYAALSEFSEYLPAELPLVGNFQAVRDIQAEVIQDKEAILAEKCAGFIPAARAELTELLSGFRENHQGNLKLISEKDRREIMVIKDDVKKRINKIRAEIQSSVGEWLVKVENQKAEGVRELRAAAKENQTLETRTGTETKTGSYRVSDSKWYNPFSWGSSHTEYYTYETSYTYVMASDAVDNIRQFVMDSQSCIEQAFSDAVSHGEMKRRLLETVADNFDMSDENYDASLFRLMVEQEINKINFPIIQIDCSRETDAIASRFSGQLRDSNDQSALRDALARGVDAAFNALVDQFDKSASAFKHSLSAIGDNLQETLLQDMNRKFDDLLAQLDEKDRSIEQLKTYIGALDQALKEVRQWTAD